MFAAANNDCKMAGRNAYPTRQASVGHGTRSTVPRTTIAGLGGKPATVPGGISRGV
jgi:hypothetical protein